MIALGILKYPFFSLWSVEYRRFFNEQACPLMPKAKKIITFAHVIIEQLWGIPGERTQWGCDCSTQLFYHKVL